MTGPRLGEVINNVIAVWVFNNGGFAIYVVDGLVVLIGCIRSKLAEEER